MKSKISRKRKYNRTRKGKFTKKSRKTLKKGGLLFDQKLDIGGIELARESGKKRYNWETGKWDDVICYKAGPIPFCKIVPAK